MCYNLKAMITSRVEIDKQVIKEMSKRYFIFSLLLATIGIAGGVTFLLLYIFLNKNKLFMIPLIIFFAFGVVGVYYIISMFITNKRAFEAHAVLTVDIDETGVVIHPYKNDRKGGDVKVSYSDISHYKESKNYLFVYLNRRNSFPVIKDENLPQILDIFARNNIIKK